MNVSIRPATDAEICEELHSRHYRWHHNEGTEPRVSFDIYIREGLDTRTEYGVRRITRGSAKIRWINRVPHVRTGGRIERLYAEIFTCGEVSVVQYTVVKPEHRS